jgi:hypothetical protein
MLIGLHTVTLEVIVQVVTMAEAAEVVLEEMVQIILVLRMLLLVVMVE